VFHHHLPDRRSQTRGVTGFAPTADTAHHWDDLGILAVNLGLPLCVFLLNASETNYSGFGGAIDQARRRWREIQWQVRGFRGVLRYVLFGIRLLPLERIGTHPSRQETKGLLSKIPKGPAT
jgi:hypothetical protein